MDLPDPPRYPLSPLLEDVEIASTDFVRAIMRATTNFDPEQPALTGYFDIIDGFVDFAAGDASSIVGLNTRPIHPPDHHHPRRCQAPLPARAADERADPPAPGAPDRPMGVATGYDEPVGFGGEGGYGAVMVASGPYMFEGADDVDPSRPAGEREPASGFTPWRIGPEEKGVSHTAFGSMTLVRNPSWRATDDPCALPSPTASSWWATMRRSSSGRWRAATWTSCSTTSLRRRSCSGTRTIPLRPLIQTTTGSVFFSFATFNLALPPFDDIAVRRAVAFAMDRAAMAETIDPEPRGCRPALRVGHDGGVVARVVVDDPRSRRARRRGGRKQAMAESRYASGDRCTDPVCQGVPIVMRDTMRRAVPEFRARLRDLGIDAEITIDPNPYQCLDPEQRIGMCIGMGWSPDYLSADQYIGAFFASDGQLAATRLGAAPKELRGWGVRRHPGTDRRRASRALPSGDRSQPGTVLGADRSVRGEPADARGPDRGDQPAATLLVADRLAAVGPDLPATGARPHRGRRRNRIASHAGRTATQTAPSPSTVRAEGAPSSATDPATSRVAVDGASSATSSTRPIPSRRRPRRLRACCSRSRQGRGR